jgi:hypothetical protein
MEVRIGPARRNFNYFNIKGSACLHRKVKLLTLSRSKSWKDLVAALAPPQTSWATAAAVAMIGMAGE